MSKLDSTDMRDQVSGGSPGPKPKSAAASRILRAVEKSRSGGDAPPKPETEANKDRPGDQPTAQEPSSSSKTPAASAERNVTVENNTGHTAAASPASEVHAPEATTPVIAVRVYTTPTFDPLEAEETLRSLSAQQPPRQTSEPVFQQAAPQRQPAESARTAPTTPAAASPAASSILKSARTVPSPEPPAAAPQAAATAPEPPASSATAPSPAAEKADKKNGRKPTAATTAQQAREAVKETPGKAKANREDTPAKPSGRDKNNSSSIAKAVSETASAAADDSPTLSLSGPVNDSFLARVPSAIKAGAFLLLLVGGGAAFYKFSGSPVDAKGAKSSQDATANPVFVPMSGVGGWSPNWGGDASKTGGRSISMFRPSLQQVNYRIEFEGQIEQKGFGWVFRASDAQNFHAYKVEVVKPGLEPLVALARVSVVNGVESQKHYTLLDKPMRLDTVFKIRMDANKQQFKTWINDHLVETWTDDRLNSGGVGLFTEKSEAAQIRKVQIFEMR